jgi:hypothetical protein
VCDEIEGFAVDMVSVRNGATLESLDKAQRACDVRKVVGMIELEADMDARSFRTINGVGGEWK